MVIIADTTCTLSPGIVRRRIVRCKFLKRIAAGTVCSFADCFEHGRVRGACFGRGSGGQGEGLD